MSSNYDDHKIVKVLNHFIEHEANKYKSIGRIFIENGKIHLEKREKAHCGYIPTMCKVPISSYKSMYRRYIRGMKRDDRLTIGSLKC